jgi:type 1 glutamine amidotransferase
MARNLLLTGGIFHPFEETSPAVADLLAPLGVETTIFEDVEEGLALLDAGGHELLTVNCLRWTMTQAEKYEPFRAQWAMSLSPAGRAAILRHLARGGGLLGVHTACICFDDWPEWRDALGVGWVWGRSFHPPLGPIDVRARGDHPAVTGARGFTVVDEVYTDLDRAPGAEVVLEARTQPDGAWTPVGVAQTVGAGRALWLGLGHDVASLRAPEMARILRRGALWCLGRPADAADALTEGAA